MRLSIIPILALGLAACADTPPIDPDAPPGPELTAAITGRTAGPADNCVPQRDLTGNRSVDNGAAIVFDGPGNLIYVNRPSAGCPALKFGRTLVTRTIGSSLCRGDIAEVVDLTSGTHHGSCSLGDFVPYRRSN
jgi:hypothetical protein